MPTAALNRCAKCGKAFLANKRGIKDYCPHCKGDETFFIGSVGTGYFEAESRLFLDHDAGLISGLEIFKERYIAGLENGKYEDIAFNEWLHSEYYGIEELDVDQLKKDVFPYLAEVIETYVPLTDQTYLIGRWITNTWDVDDCERIELLNWYYGKPSKEITDQYLGKLKDLTLDFIDWNLVERTIKNYIKN